MNIIYIDEYGEDLLNIEGSVLPSPGDSVIIDGEDWVVKSRTFEMNSNSVAIELTQNMVRAKPINSTVTDDRLNEVQASIIKLKREQDAQAKKTRMLREELVTVKTHIRSQARTPTNDTR